MIALSVAFFVLWLSSILIEPFGELVGNYLILTETGVTERYSVWSFATYAFFHNDFVAVLFTAVALWLFGGELQSRWSAKKWWLTQLAAAVAGGLVCFLGLWLFDSGMEVRSYHAPVMALVFSYCWLHWRAPLHFFFFAMTGRTMLLFFLGLGILMAIFSGHYAMIGLDLAGVAVGFLASTRTLNLRDIRTRIRLWQARRKLKIVRSPEDDKKPPRKTADGHYIN